MLASPSAERSLTPHDKPCSFPLFLPPPQRSHLACRIVCTLKWQLCQRRCALAAEDGSTSKPEAHAGKGIHLLKALCLLLRAQSCQLGRGSREACDAVKHHWGLVCSLPIPPSPLNTNCEKSKNCCGANKSKITCSWWMPPAPAELQPKQFPPWSALEWGIQKLLRAGRYLVWMGKRHCSSCLRAVPVMQEVSSADGSLSLSKLPQNTPEFFQYVAYEY